MRTTVTLSQEHHVALRTLAARRGTRGFSVLVAEAIDLLIASDQGAETAAALAAAGALDDREADRLQSCVDQLRARSRRTTHDDGQAEVA